MTNSSTGGFLTPLSTLPTPIEGQALNRFLQPAIVALTGLASNYVVPGNQSEPPNIPTAGDAWCTFFYEKIDADVFPFIGHATDSNGNGYDQLQRHELWAIKCDFFDLGTNGLASYYATLLRDNLAIPQNREFLLPQSFNLRGVGSIDIIPVIFKQRWQYRERFTFYLKRNSVRNYATLNLASGQFTFYVGNLSITETVGN
jgi:hypothetical protein